MLRISRLQNPYLLPKVQEQHSGLNLNTVGNDVTPFSVLYENGTFSRVGHNIKNIFHYLMGVGVNPEDDDNVEPELTVDKNNSLSDDELFKKNLTRLKTLGEEIQALQGALLLMDWDMQINAMPEKSKDYRAWQISVLK